MVFVVDRTGNDVIEHNLMCAKKELCRCQVTLQSILFWERSQGTCKNMYHNCSSIVLKPRNTEQYEITSTYNDPLVVEINFCVHMFCTVGIL